VSETSTAPSLLPLPDLNQRHLQLETVRPAAWRALDAFVPAPDSPYACKDPAAPALVLVPGLGMDGLGFIRQLPLGSLAHLHFFQTPNEEAAGEEALGHFARHVEEYIFAQRLDKHPGGLILGGCSMGGAVSLAVAIRGRVPLHGLILIGTFGNAAHLPFWQRLAAPLSWYLPPRTMRRFAKQVVARTSYFGTVNAEEADWLVSCKLDRTRHYFGRAVLALTRQNQIEAARKLSLPTLVLHGTCDNVLPYKAGQELASAIPGARLVTIEQCGHALFFTHHQVVNDAIAEFIRTQRQASGPS